MANDIRTVHCKLISLCSLQGEVRQQVRQEWEERFHEHEAFWLDVEESQSGVDMARAVTHLIRNQGIMTMAGKKVIIAAFFDLAHAPNEALAKEIAQVPALLKGALGCTVALTMEFGNLGEMAFADKDKLRSHVKQIVEVNKENPNDKKQLCLVASSPLVMPEDDSSWKAVMVSLDVLRRLSAPAQEIAGGNPDGDVGFIRYGEYDARKLSELTDRKTKILTALGNDGAMKLKDLIRNELSALEMKIEETYVVTGSVQPIHPDMIVSGGINRWKAGKGKLDSFEKAKNSTWSAMDMTGQNLRSMIAAGCREQIEDAEGRLARFLEEAGVGVQLEADAQQMESILRPEKMTVAPPIAPSLSYKPEGWVKDIEEYLLGVRRHAAAKAKQDMAQSLLDAYRKIPASVYTEKSTGLTKRLKQVETRLGNVMSRADLINLLPTGAPLPETCFFPFLGGGFTASWALCRKPADAADLDGVCTGTNTTVYYIDETVGGLKLVDNAPIKAVQIILSNCDDAHLNDMIK